MMNTERAKSKISVVIPVQNESGNVTKLVKKLKGALKGYSDYEIIFVDDGSTDSTLEVIKNERARDRKIGYLSFSRNFGHQNALRAGLDNATGDCVITLDGDLQHPPELIPDMIKKWREGYDIVYTIRMDDPSLSFFKRFTAGFFYSIVNRMSDINVDGGAADFRLLDRTVVDVLKNITESDLFMRGVISWVGFKQYAIEYMPEKRTWGKTKYSLKKMIKFALSGITSFSVKPLQLSTFLGFIFSVLAFIYGTYAIYIKLFTANNVPGWASTLVAILFIGGVQMIMIGILGEYIGRLFMEAKKRPNYIIREKSD